MQNTLNKTSQRYSLIDALRGFALINMVVFHLLYDIFEIYKVDSGWYYQPLTTVWERCICVSFILISGISFNFSHHAYKRGIILNLCGFLITIVTSIAMPQSPVWFGVLNFIGCAMLIMQPLRTYAEKIQPVSGMIVSLVLYAVTYGIPERFLGIFGWSFIRLPDEIYSLKWLAFLGLPSGDFVSSDYFPIIPWFFLFALGYFLWRFVKAVNADRFFKLQVPVLDFIGRHTLIVYLVHQPVIVGVLMLVFK